MDFYSADDLWNNEIMLRLDRTCDAQPEKDWVPAYYFSVCLSDGTKIGQCDLRIGHNDRLYIGGNIGYQIDEAFRGHHYAAKACELLFRLAGKHGMEYVLITCDPSNKASSRTCELAGGQYLETAEVPEWHNMYYEGKRQVMIYRFDLTETSDHGSPAIRFSGQSNSRGKEWTFDTAAAAYEKIRPGYPDELYRMMFDYCPVRAGSRAVEVGIGGGQAALPVLKTGCTVTAVEYGENLARICREKFRSYRDFSVITGRFEQVILPEESYDLVYSASAFHWIPEDTGYTKVYRLLKSGGAFARFANHPYRGRNNPDLFGTIDDLYAKYYYPYYHKQPVKIHEYTEDQAAERAKIAEKYGFTDVRYALFYRTRTLSAGEYRMMIGTYSDHISMEKSIREKFFDEIEDAINRYGGFITLFDTIDLQLARRP